jgi:hypothetical protein
MSKNINLRIKTSHRLHCFVWTGSVRRALHYSEVTLVVFNVSMVNQFTLDVEIYTT